MSNSSILSIDTTLAGATTPDQSGLGSNDSKGVLHIPQRSKTWASSSDGLESYLEHSLAATFVVGVEYTA